MPRSPLLIKPSEIITRIINPSRSNRNDKPDGYSHRPLLSSSSRNGIYRFSKSGLDHISLPYLKEADEGADDYVERRYTWELEVCNVHSGSGIGGADFSIFEDLFTWKGR